MSYQVMLLGDLDWRSLAFRRGLEARLEEIGLNVGTIAVLEGVTPSVDRKLPLFAIFLGAPSEVANSSFVGKLIEDSVSIVPTVSSISHVGLEIPPQLRNVNALEVRPENGGIDRLVSLVLEAFRLLRPQRRLFISYRREDSQPFAEILYDALDRKGFDVFIDVRSVPPGVDFQNELWHRMSDADIVVLVDTPGFRASRWTTAELARANATNIQILHVLWPGQQEDSGSAFSHFFKLKRSDFRWGFARRGQGVRPETLTRIYSKAEQLRARAIAARQRYLVDNFCDAARDLGMTPAVQAENWISVARPGGRSLAVIPAVGVPTSDRLNSIFESLYNSQKSGRDLWAIYDNRGILEDWLNHLDWLNAHLPIQAIRMAEAPALLRSLP